MVARLGMVALFLAAVALCPQGANAATLRPAKNRPDIIEVGDPVLVGRAELSREMELNSALREYIHLYGWPDYVEIQEVTVQDPWAAYEVRLFYLRRDEYLVYGRVHAAPSIGDYGIRKYAGTIDSETLDRLLTASPPPAPEVGRHTTGADAGMEGVRVEAPVPVMVEVEGGAGSPDRLDAVATTPPALPAASAADAPIAADAPAEAPAPRERAAGSPDLSQIVARLEAAADRAALAAEVAERASLAATASADRATSVLERIASQYQD